MHEVNVQRAVLAAVRDLQEVLGHGSLTTTMRYLAADSARVRSSLERLGGGRTAWVEVVCSAPVGLDFLWSRDAGRRS